MKNDLYKLTEEIATLYSYYMYIIFTDTTSTELQAFRYSLDTEVIEGLNGKKCNISPSFCEIFICGLSEKKTEFKKITGLPTWFNFRLRRGLSPCFREIFSL